MGPGFGSLCAQGISGSASAQGTGPPGVSVTLHLRTGPVTRFPSLQLQSGQVCSRLLQVRGGQSSGSSASLRLRPGPGLGSPLTAPPREGLLPTQERGQKRDLLLPPLAQGPGFQNHRFKGFMVSWRLRADGRRSPRRLTSDKPTSECGFGSESSRGV